MNIEAIWQQYSQSLKALLRSKISNPSDADDLLQEILIKTDRNIGKLKSRDKLRPWLFQLANNTIIDFYRKKRHFGEADVENLWYEDDGPQAQQQLSECILPFVNALPPDTAELLRAIDIEGRSQKEFAAESGIAYSTLKSRVQRGRIQLRELFENCCHLSVDRHGNIFDYDAKPGSCADCDEQCR